MITIMVLLTLVILGAFIAALIKGLVVISPVLLAFALLPLIDVVVFKVIADKLRKDD